jgi:hypothetical protein
MLASKVKIVDGRVKTKDSKITIIIEEEKDHVDAQELEENIPIQGENYKGYDIEQDIETGEFDIYSTGGAIVAHAATIELARKYIDSVDLEG